MAENQFRKQVELEQDAHIEAEMLRQKERSEMAERAKMEQRRAEFFAHKRNIQDQMQLQAQLRAEAQ